MASDSSKIFAFVPQEHQIRMCSDERDKVSSTRVCFCLKKFSSGLAYRPLVSCKKPSSKTHIFSTSLFRVEIFENAGFAFTCGRAKTEVFKYDNVIYHMLLALRMLRKGCFRILVSLSLTAHGMPHIYRFSVFVWTRGGGGVLPKMACIL